MIRIDVNLVQVDAVVTDSHDRPVTDLNAEDFTIVQDGKNRDIANFAFVRTKPRTVRAVVAAAPPSNRAAPTPIEPPKPLNQSQARRVVALVVDDLGLSYRSITQVQQSLKKWVNDQMDSGDLVAIVQTGLGMGVLQQFTNDKRLLNAAIERVRYNTAGRIGIEQMSGNAWTSGTTKVVCNPTATASNPNGINPNNPNNQPGDCRTLINPNAGNAANMEHRMDLTMGTLGSIQYVLDGLKKLPGRKSLIFFSEDLSMKFPEDGAVETPLAKEELTVRDKYQRIIDSANRSSVVIHAIDAKGLTVVFPPADAKPDNPMSFTQPFIEQVDAQDGMIRLAKQTGGLFVQNRNDIEQSLQEVVEDGDGYYLIGYTPDAALAAEMRTGTVGFHDIHVRVNRPGLHVRTRSGFLGTPEKEIPPEQLEDRLRIAQSLYSPFSSGSLKLRLTAMFAQIRPEEFGVNALLHFEARDLKFSNEPDDWHEAVVDIIAAAFNPDGKQMDLSDKRWTIRVPGKIYQDMLKDGISFLIHVPTTKPGPYQMRVVLWDVVSGEMGNATQFIEVPDVHSGKLALSGILLSAGDSGRKNGAEQTEGVIADDNPKGTAAVRIFEPGETLSWAYQVLNAKTNEQRKPKLQAQVRLFHDGREVYEGEPSAITASEVSDKLQRILVTGKMQLKQAQPGDYALQVVVKDLLAKEKQGTAAQSIDFEVEGK